jgi:hypothetical protein
MEGRQHAVESLQASIIASIIDYICLPANSNLRDKFHWYIIPAVNPDKCAVDGTAKYVWQTWASDNNLTIVTVRNMLNCIHKNYTLDAFFDWHSLGSGYPEHIIYKPTDIAGAKILKDFILPKIKRKWTGEPVGYNDNVAYCYAFDKWGCPSFTPEPSQREWDLTDDILYNDGKGIVDGLYEYFYPIG